MKANFLALGLFGLAGASAVLPRNDYPAKSNDYPAKPNDYPAKPTGYPTKSKPTYSAKDDYATSPQYADENDYEDGYDYKNSKGTESSWKPKSKSPEFFNLRVDEKCNVVNGVTEAAADCPFNGYAIRLEGGIFIATPYNKWWDPKLPTFFVDDDTQLYTVSVVPLRPCSASTNQMCRSARTLSRSTLTASLAPSSTPRSDGFLLMPFLSASTTLVTTLLVLSTPAPPTSAGPAPRAAASSAALGFSALSAAPSSTRSSSTVRTSVSAA